MTTDEVEKFLIDHGFNKEVFLRAKPHTAMGHGNESFSVEIRPEEIYIEAEFEGLIVLVYFDLNSGMGSVYDYSPFFDNRCKTFQYECKNSALTTV